MPLVMGHEFCGVIEEVGKDVQSFKKGHRVLVPFSQGDGICEYCRNGHSNVCANPRCCRAFPTGAATAPLWDTERGPNLVPMPEEVGFLEGASMGCRFMTSYHGIVDRAQVRPGEWVAVHGCGGIGLSAIHVAAAIGANVIAVDLDGRKLELAKSVGAQYVINGKNTTRDGDFDLTKGGAHVAVDALGIKATCRNAILSLRKQGRALQIGLTTQAEQGEMSRYLSTAWSRWNCSLLRRSGCRPRAIPRCCRWSQAKKLNPKSMITETVGLDGASRVLEEMTTFQNVGVSIIDAF